MYPVVFGHLSHHWSNGFAHYFEQEVDNSKIETTLEILQVTAEHFKTPFRVIYNDPLSQTKEYQLSIPQGETRPKLFPLFNTAIELISASHHVTWCSSARELTHIIIRWSFYKWIEMWLKFSKNLTLFLLPNLKSFSGR